MLRLNVYYGGGGMSDEQGPQDPQWLMEPPGAGEFHFYLKAGDGASLSPEGRAALETLMDELQRSEAEGFATTGPECPSYWDCYPYTCTLKNCQPQYRNPCFVDAGCKIAEVRIR
jgi:hypothetical protein